jgi:hypothetical protein
MPDLVAAAATTAAALSGKLSMVCPGMNQVDLMPCFPRSARTRRAPTSPNSPRDIGDGVTRPRAMKPDTASKSNVRQAIRFAIVDAPEPRGEATAGPHPAHRSAMRPRDRTPPASPPGDARMAAPGRRRNLPVRQP